MLRKLVGSLVLAALVTTSARAQFIDNSFFGVNPGGPGSTDFANFYGEFNNPALDAQTGVVSGTPFQIFCVDEIHLIGASYDVWVTPMSASDFSHTREVIDFGQSNSAAASLYFQAAALASGMLFPVGTGPDNATTDNLEYAIWQVLGYPSGSNLCNGVGTPVSSCVEDVDPTSDYNSTTVANDLAFFTPANTGISPNQWLVITAFNLQANDYQEFIYNGPGRPFETPVPEPGTMAMLAVGLVGMAGAGIRRRKKK